MGSANRNVNKKIIRIYTLLYSAPMSPLLRSVQMRLLIFAGWVNRHQLEVIEYLQEENRVLKERMGGRRLRFTDAEGRRLAR